MFTYTFLLGKTPLLSIAELCAFFKQEDIVDIDKETLTVELSEAIKDPIALQNRLGGVLKIMEIFTTLENPFKQEEVTGKFLKQIFKANLSRPIFGLNLYNQTGQQNLLKKLLPDLKKRLKKHGVPSRFVNKNFQNLPTASSLAEKLVPINQQFNNLTIQPSSNSNIKPSKAHIYSTSLSSELSKNLTIQQFNNQGIELNLIFSKKNIFLGQTITIQDIANYSKRDYEKPIRDSHSGLIPPKLAQIMINLGIGNPPSCNQEGVRGRSEDQSKTSHLKQNLETPASPYPLSLIPYPCVFDPFCGSGTILMEALLMGYNVIGSDLSKKAVESTQTNIAWLQKNFPINPDCSIEIFQQDAITLSDSVLKAKSYQLEATLIAEPYLGPPSNKEPTLEQIKTIQDELKKTYLSFFENLKKIIPAQTTIIIIFPYIKAHHKRHFLQITAQIENLGFTTENLISPELQKKFHLPLNQFKSLLYERKDQIVGREIWKFKKN